MHPYPASYIKTPIVTELSRDDIVRHERYLPVQPSYIALPVYWGNVVLPTPTRTGVAAQEQAVLLRVGKKTPDIDMSHLPGCFHDFAHHCMCQNEIRVGDKCLRPDEDFSSWEAFEEWLAGTHYSNPRKRQLRAVRKTMPDFPSMRQLKYWAINKCHGKLEGYPAYKPLRGIMSRTDYIKVWIGPLMKKCEHIIFQMPEFIKYVKAHTRAAYMRDRMQRAGCKYAETDFSSFEGSVRRRIMRICEFSVLLYLTRHNALARERMEQFRDICSGTNVMKYTDITAKILARRMSGEMSTSFGNGWTNLMLITFVLRDVVPEIPVLVEGDDGLVTIPQEYQSLFNAQAFAKLGFVIKIEWHDDLASSGFCGIVCDPKSEAIITDPIAAIASFGWCGGAALRSSFDTQLGLLRAKALSLAYQYPGCPILTSLARLGVRLSHGCKIDPEDNPFFDGWHKDILVNAEKYVTNELLEKEVSDGTRSVMAMKYGISVDDQKKTEDYLDSITDHGVLEMPWLESHATNDMRDAGEYFVRTYTSGTPWYMIARALN